MALPILFDRHCVGIRTKIKPWSGERPDGAGCLPHFLRGQAIPLGS
jgi:hypothetical protein